MKKAALLLGILFVTCLVTQAQEDIFKKHGVTKEPLTLSKGKYKETFYNEEIMQIGTVLINTNTNKVVKFLEEDTTKLAYRAETTSRFLTVDPLAEKYYSWSPYVYVGNNPIIRTDPTGMDWYEDEKGNVMWQEGSDKTVTKTYEGENGSITVKYRNVGTSYTVNVDDNVSIRYEQNAIDNVLYLDQDLKNINPQLSASTREPSFFENWSNSDNFLASLAYNILNDAYVTIQPFTFGLVGQTTNEFTGGIAHTNLDGTTNYTGINSAASTGALLFGGSAASSSTKAATGGLKQWVRVGSSYSHNLGSRTALSIRWGASPRYANRIGNTSLRNLNQSIRQFKLPGDSWRVKDAGHFHITR